MPDDNPYQPPSTTSSHDERRLPVGHDGKIAHYAQLGLRLLGVMFLVDGVGGIIGSLAYAAFQSSALQQAGYDPLPDAYVFGWFATSAALLIAGIYFVVGGRWVLEKVFLPPSPTPDDDDVDATTNE
jgi:hypothetical protein